MPISHEICPECYLEVSGKPVTRVPEYSGPNDMVCAWCNKVLYTAPKVDKNKGLQRNPRTFDKGFYWHYSVNSPSGVKKWPGADGLSRAKKEAQLFPQTVFNNLLPLARNTVIKGNAWIYKNRHRLPEDIRNLNLSNLRLLVRADKEGTLLDWGLYDGFSGPQLGSGRISYHAGYWQTTMAKLAFQGFGIYPAIIKLLSDILGETLHSSQSLSDGAHKAWQRAGGTFDERRYQVNPLNYRERLEEAIEDVSGDFADYYPQSAAGTYDAEREESLYRGHRVIWDGIEGQMVRIPAANVVWDPLNELYPEKLAAVVDGIESGDDIILQASWGSISKVDLQTIKESIQYGDDDEYGVLTTGDEELDEFLIDPGEVITNYYDSDEPEAFCEKYKELQQQLEQAVKKQKGDIGEWLYHPVDGHHRIWGAILAGEPYVWVILRANQIQDAREGASEEAREIAEMLE